MKLSMAMLWSALAIAPLAWFLSLETNFALAPLACSGRGKGLLYAVSGLAFLLSVFGGALSWIQHSLLTNEREPRIEVRQRKRAMAFAGITLNVLFALVILAQSIPNLMLAGCE